MGVRFAVLYTHQKNKKRKVWQDGLLEQGASGNRFVLYDEHKSSIDSVYSKTGFEVGSEIETDKHLITVDAIAEGKQKQASEPSEQVLESNVSQCSGIKCRESAIASKPLSAASKTGSIGRLKYRKVGLSKRGFQPPRTADTTRITSSEDSENNPTRLSGRPHAFSVPCKTTNTIPRRAFRQVTVKRSNVNDEDSEEVIQKEPIAYSRPKVNEFRQKISLNKLQIPDKESIAHVAPDRNLKVPLSFANIGAYKMCMTSLLYEYVNISLFKTMKIFHELNEGIDTTPFTGSEGRSFIGKETMAANVPSCPHGKAAIKVVKKDGPNKGRQFYCCNVKEAKTKCNFFKWVETGVVISGNDSNKSDHTMTLSTGSAIEDYFHSHGIDLYCPCELAPKTGKYGNFGNFVHLVLSSKRKSSVYSKDDLWIIAPSLNFIPSESLIGRNTFYGPSSDGKLEISIVTNSHNVRKCFGKELFAIHFGNVSNELVAIEAISNFMIPSIPIGPFLLGNPNGKSQNAPQSENDLTLNIPTARKQQLVKEFIEKYNLNDDQARCLRAFSEGIPSSDIPCNRPSMTLIQGTFGAGKSYLLSVMILYLLSLFEEHETSTTSPAGPKWKILISCMTNVAVDRILTGLLDLDCSSFIRVGNVRKIARPILPFSIRSLTNEKQDIKDLKAMLKNNVLSDEEIKQIKLSIERISSGHNQSLLENVPVIGTTCCSSVSPILSGFVFPIVLLDECSQLTEPMCLLPLSRFSSSHVILCGDPKQLPPTVGGSDAAHDMGLEQTLFSRMKNSGIGPILLRTQYRCHPSISRIANHLFYDSVLVDGVTMEDRGPILEHLPPLCFIDVIDGQEKKAGDGSYYNEREATFVSQLIILLSKANVPDCDVGVITLYRAHAAMINQKLDVLKSKMGMKTKITISTVDAFQGGEKNIIILSCARTEANAGFTDSACRVNVAITRAKRHLLVVGRKDSFTESLHWRAVLKACKEMPNGVKDYHDFLFEFEANNDQAISLEDKKHTKQSEGYLEQQPNVLVEDDRIIFLNPGDDCEDNQFEYSPHEEETINSSYDFDVEDDEEFLVGGRTEDFQQMKNETDTPPKICETEYEDEFEHAEGADDNVHITEEPPETLFEDFNKHPGECCVKAEQHTSQCNNQTPEKSGEVLSIPCEYANFYPSSPDIDLSDGDSDHMM